VTSKAVLEKCRAEGIELKNHMAALSAGLEATIHEWFSEGAVGTAVETTEHVDLESARKKAAAARRRRKKKAAEEQAEADQAVADVPAAPAAAEAPAAAPTTEAAPAEPVAVPEAAPPEAAPPAVEPAAPSEAPAEAPPEEPALVAEVETTEVETPPVEPAAPARPRAVPNEPDVPEVIAPAGPQVVPKPAQLQGPRVVRFEGVDVVPKRPAAGGLTPGERAPGAPAGPAKRGLGDEERARRSKRRSPRRKSGRTAETTERLREWRDRDLIERSERLAAASGGTLRRHRAAVGRGRGDAHTGIRTGEVDIAEPITIKSLSAATGMKINTIIRHLMSMDVLATVNSVLSRQVAQAVALDHGIELKIKVALSAEEQLEESLAGRQADAGEATPRAPIVAFLGHVDHGKTSLLDHIRHARVADGEEGGITQHVGSYRYDEGGKHVVFLDTPGHEAFTAMRARGANMTDVVVLVVAADDGVMPQTVEAISHAKAAEVPIVVALNKIDLPNANVQRALGQLAEQGLQPREWGGQTEVIQTSAETGEGLDTLVETLALEAELLELTADAGAPGDGYVVEAQRDPSRGVLAHLLVRDGTLRTGDAILCGRGYGRVRSLTDDRGRSIAEAGPATPVEVTGLDEVPDAGDRFHVMADLAQAKQVAEERRQRQRMETLAAAPTTSLESVFERIEAGKAGELRLIVKADVHGSLEALLSSLAREGHEEIRVVILHSGVGGVTEGDVLLAEASEAIILGFQVVADQRARALAEAKGVEIRTYRVIYQLLEDVAKAVKGLLTPEFVEQVTGRVEVREVFRISRLGTVGGGYVLDGVIARNAKIRIIRDNVVIEDERELESLRRFKDDAREVRAGLECGLKIAGYDDVKVGDVIEAYQSVEVARE